MGTIDGVGFAPPNMGVWVLAPRKIFKI